MRARVFALLLGIFTAVAGRPLDGNAQAPNEPEAATVVVYSGGSFGRNMLPRSNAGSFTGGIFDNDKAMARLSYRSILILRIHPGGHTFSASLSDWHAAKNSQIYIDLAPGHTYYLRAMLEHDSLSIAGSNRGRLETVSCETALNETTKHSLVADSYIGDDYKKSALDEIPPCVAPASH